MVLRWVSERHHFVRAAGIVNATQIIYGYNLAFMQLPQTGKHMHRLSMLMEYAPYGVSQSVCRNLIISQLIR